MLKSLLIILIIGLFLVSACQTQKQRIPIETEDTTEIESINNTNTTNITQEVVIETKPITVFTPRTENLTMYVLDTKGSSVIFQYKEKAILIDSGYKEDSEKILKSIRDLGIEQIDYIFATNTKPKNIGGMPYLIVRTKPNNIVENGIPSSYEAYKEYKEVYNETIIIKNDQTFNLDDFAVRVIVGYDDGTGFSPNLDDNSLVLKVTYGTSNFLLMSDCELDCEERIKNDNLEAEIIKISSSCDSTSLTFLQRVNPKVAVVQTKQLDQDFCPNIIERFTNLNIPLIMTSEKGDIYITTDGLEFDMDWKKE